MTDVLIPSGVIWMYMNILPSTRSRLAVVAVCSLALTGCSVIAVADAAVSTGVTVVSAGVSVVGAAVDVAAAGVKAVVK